MHRALKHGFAVATGMELATEFSFQKKYINLKEKDRIINLLKRFNLIDKLDLKDDEMKKLVLHDKKKTGTDLHFVFTHGLGKAIVEKVPVDEVLAFYKNFRDKK
jgi:3-dehydroquinate synthetase